MPPIGKGSRFLVLSGPLRGREGTIADPVRDCPGLWWLNIEGTEFVLEQAEADGPNFKRLPDAPAEVDPLFAEIAALEAKRLLAIGGPDADDAICPSELPRLALDEIERADSVIGADVDNPDDIYRAAMMRAALYCIAAVRCIDRVHKG